MSLGQNVAIQESFGDSVPGPPKLPAAAGIAVPLITAADDVWGLRCSRRNAPGREGKRGGGTRGAAAEKLCSIIAPAKLRRPSAPGVALRASSPLPRSCDKGRRERAEPTFTTAGTSKASLLNPVSNGYQHRASNVIRPAAAATSLRGEPGARAHARARGRARSLPLQPGRLREEARASGSRAYLFPRASPGT